MKCPHCGLLNPDEALQCDCGYPFEMQVPADLEKRAFQRICKAANILAWGWLLNNLFGFFSAGVLIYLIWWRWHLGLLAGIVPLLVGAGLINVVILPALFSALNKPFAKMVKSGAVTLATLVAIDENTVRKMADTKVEHWPEVVASSMGNTRGRSESWMR